METTAVLFSASLLIFFFFSVSTITHRCTLLDETLHQHVPWQPIQ